MYYILNETNQIIAADADLLALCGVSHIDELSSKIVLKETTFNTVSEESIIITTDNNDKTFSLSKTTLSSMLGHLTLVDIKAEEEASDLSEFIVEDNLLDDITIDDTPKSSQPLDLDEDLISILDIDEESSVPSDDLIKSIPQEDLFPQDDSEILIDIENISQAMGVSEDDYNTFLNEYIDTALGLEQDLQSNDEAKRSNAIGTLSHLSDVLRLPVIDSIIKKVSAADADTQKEVIESFYTTLSRLTTQQVVQETSAMELLDTVTPEEDSKISIVTKPEPTVNENSFGTISLEGIKPIHFDFQLEEAANDLSLPVELIEEFVHDFIDQGHIETKKMLEAYEKGDLVTIQNIGHLLKGASSNLRINALSDTLYQIQFCEDSSNLEAYIKDYWGHFLSFEIQINAISN